ncbi:MAG: iron-containing redox enzyme family protein [Marmoricola sp.]
MRLPLPRGPLSHAVFTALRGEGDFPRVAVGETDDAQISLWALYELHYRGFDEVHDRYEWDPAAIGVRRQLEERFEADLRDLTADLVSRAREESTDLAEQITLIVNEPGPSVASYLHRDATREQYEEFLRERSVYHLKEADPHSWTLPRLAGAAKTALAEIQYDEYGSGDPTMLHQQLFADALESMGLDAAYGAYIDEVPAHTLAVNNAMSLFGLQRRLRGASMGHLAAFEMTSSLPCRRFAQGAERLELPAAVVRYFDEHVEADAVHEQLALHSLCVPLVEDAPALHDDVLFGAAACVLLDAVAGEATITAWETDQPADAVA